jgi:hypothetical protein
MKEAPAPRLWLAAPLAIFAVFLSTAHAPAATAPGGSDRKIWTFTFAGDTLGQAPPHTIVHGGTWAVEEDSTAPAGRVLRQEMNDDGVAWHYLQFTRPLLEDVTVSVRFRIESGEIDPSAGILFQLDPKGRSGYLVRLRGESHEIAFHYLLYGKRRDVRFVKIDWPEPGTWHTLAVRREGHRLTVFYDGREVMRVRDERYRKGTFGLWTENDSVVDFADLEVGVP